MQKYNLVSNSLLTESANDNVNATTRWFYVSFVQFESTSRRRVCRWAFVACHLAAENVTWRGHQGTYAIVSVSREVSEESDLKLVS